MKKNCPLNQSSQNGVKGCMNHLGQAHNHYYKKFKCEASSTVQYCSKEARSHMVTTEVVSENTLGTYARAHDLKSWRARGRKRSQSDQILWRVFSPPSHMHALYHKFKKKKKDTKKFQKWTGQYCLCIGKTKKHTKTTACNPQILCIQKRKKKACFICLSNIWKLKYIYV